MRPVTLTIYDTVERGLAPLAQMDINPRVTALSWSHKLPGGPNTLSVGIEEPELRAGWGTSYGYIPEAIETKAFAHVVASVGGMVCWEGRIGEDEIGPLGIQAFIADGYAIAGTNGDYYESTSAVATTTGDILDDILAESATLLSKGTVDEWSDPGITHTRAEYDGMTLAQVLDQVLQEGGSGYVTWDWWITIGRRLALLPRIAPETPDYLIPYRPGEVSIRRNYRDIATSAVVTYTTGGVEAETAAENRDTTSIQYRINRRVRIAGDELTATGAAQLRSMELTRRSQPTYAITVTRGPDDDQWLTTPGGIGVPHWAVMAGQWVQVADMPPQIIVSVSFDPSRGITLDLGAPSRQSFATYLAATCTEVNKMAAKINPKTGGRRVGIQQTTDIGTAATASFADVNTYLNSLRSKLQTQKLMG